jgi:hypothetical protein
VARRSARLLRRAVFRSAAAPSAWPVSTRVNKADNDDAAILDRVEAAA